MAITLLTVATLVVRAEGVIAGYLSWATGIGTSLGVVTQVQLRGYRGNVASFEAECAAIIAHADYATLSADLQTDLESIQSALAGVLTVIDTALDVDDQFDSLDSSGKDGVVESLRNEENEELSSEDLWDTLAADLKADIIQHEAIDTTTIDDILAAVAISEA